MLGTFKGLVQFNNRLEKRWSIIDVSRAPVVIQAGWHIIEFTVENVINHTPRLVVDTADAGRFDRYLEGFHTGSNRMLVHLPKGHLSAYSESMTISRLARVSAIEGRARIGLICLRYLYDFPRPRVLLTMIGMIFQKPAELSTNILQFYLSKTGYLSHLEGYQWWHAWAPLIRWWYRKFKILVVIESEAQRGSLRRLMFPPETIALNTISSKEMAQLLRTHDYVFYLNKSEQFRQTSLLLFKRAILRAKAKRGQLPAMVYCDHDFESSDQDESPTRQPVFKPSPSLAYLYCFDYVQFACGFAAHQIEAQHIEQIVDQAERYYFALDLFADTNKILHVDEVLIKSSRTSDLVTPPPNQPNSPWNDINWVRRDNYNALVAKPKLETQPSVDLIIPTRDGLNVLKPCIDSILQRTDYANFHIYIVDNGSEKPETLAFFNSVTQDPRVEVVEYPGEFNYSAINNFAAERGQGDYIALVNNDIEVIEADWLRQMMAWAMQPTVGIVGAKLLFGNGLVQHAGVTVGMGNAAGHIHRLEPRASTGYQYRCAATQNMMAVTAACLITPRDVFEQIGGLDSDVFKVAYNDIDYCLKVEKSGLDIIWTPEAVLYHHESVSRGDDMSDKHIARYFRELAAFQKRWKSKGFVDKYYNKHLRVGDEGVYPQMPGNQTDRLIEIV